MADSSSTRGRYAVASQWSAQCLTIYDVAESLVTEWNFNDLTVAPLCRSEAYRIT